MPELIFTEKQAGKRLDQALEDFFPNLGLRGRRRLLASGEVLLNGKPAKSSARVQAGDMARIPDLSEPRQAAGAFLLERGDPYLFFFKPAGLHTAHINASPLPSLEGALSALAQGESQDIRLLQRLDRGTSGIVAAAISPKAEEEWRRMEKEGRTQKYYLAILEGRLNGPVAASRALDTDNRRKTRVLDRESPNATSFTPLYYFEDGQDFGFSGQGAFTLAGCRLSSGQRHQIRAHAAWLGHPLFGDSLYGKGDGDFILQHCALSFPGRKVILAGPEFLGSKLPAPASDAARSWLSSQIGEI